MSSPNRLLAAALMAALLGVLLLPLFGNAGTVVTERAPVVERAAVAPSTPLYQVRCWQYGRLLFEERDVELSGEIAGQKLRATDRNRQPVIVSDTGNATCLIRSLPAPTRR